jgi:hypothetical protein
MAYTPSYTQSDVKEIVIDGIGTAGASFVSWTEIFMLGIVVLILLGIYVKIKKGFSH